jgi:maltose-binding protein MalE
VGASEATTDHVGVATFQYRAPRRLDNVSVAFTLTATTPDGSRVDSTEVQVLGEGIVPTYGQVKGFVEGSGNALANATVQVTHRVAEMSFLNATDDDGRFVITEVPPGTVSVTATKAGFRTAGSDVSVTAGKNSHVQLGLEPLAAGTLVVWHTYEGKEKDEFNRIIARYHEWRLAQGLPAVNIEVEAQPFGGAIDKYITAALAGNAPDVMRFQNDRLGEVAKIGLLEPLDPYLTPADLGLYTEASLESMSYQNRLYALPATADLLAIVYNKDIFSSAGEAFPTPDWTTDDLQRIARNLTNPSSDRWGYVQPVTDPFWWFPWQKGFGGDIFTVPDTQAVTASGLGFDLAASARSLQWLQSLDKDPVNRTMPARPGSESMMTFFFQGQAAMVAIGAWRVPDMYAAGIDFGIVPFPIVSETGQRAQPTLGVKGFGIYRYSGQKPAALELVKYITSPEQQTIFSIETNDLPTAVAAFDNATVQANPIIILYQEQSNYAQPMPTRPEMGAVWNPITAAMEVSYNRADPTVSEIQADLAAAEGQIVERIG